MRLVLLLLLLLALASCGGVNSGTLCEVPAAVGAYPNYCDCGSTISMCSACLPDGPEQLAAQGHVYWIDCRNFADAGTWTVLGLKP